MNRIGTDSPWRWLAALSTLCGLSVLVIQELRGETSLQSVFGATSMLVGGAVLYIRFSASPYRWARIVTGPEARRFLAISLACLLLVWLAVMIVALHYLGAF
jgi:hypothetical protein